MIPPTLIGEDWGNVRGQGLHSLYPLLTRDQHLQAFGLELSFSFSRRQPGEASRVATQTGYLWVCQ